MLPYHVLSHGNVYRHFVWPLYIKRHIRNISHKETEYHYIIFVFVVYKDCKIHVDDNLCFDNDSAL